MFKSIIRGQMFIEWKKLNRSKRRKFLIAALVDLEPFFEEVFGQNQKFKKLIRSPLKITKKRIDEVLNSMPPSPLFQPDFRNRSVKSIFDGLKCLDQFNKSWFFKKNWDAFDQAIDAFTWAKGSRAYSVDSGMAGARLDIESLYLQFNHK